MFLMFQRMIVAGVVSDLWMSTKVPLLDYVHLKPEIFFVLGWRAPGMGTPGVWYG